MFRETRKDLQQEQKKILWENFIREIKQRIENGDYQSNVDKFKVEISGDSKFTKTGKIFIFLTCDWKQLWLDFDKKKISTYIKNIGRKLDNQEGRTRALYNVALKIMQEYANCRGEECIYTLETSNPKMTEWALSPKHGGSIFTWKETEVYPGMGVEQSDLLICKMYFKPQRVSVKKLG